MRRAARRRGLRRDRGPLGRGQRPLTLLAASFGAAAAGAILGILLVVAGVAKVAAGSRWPTDAAGMGAPRWLARIVPWVEIGVGAAVAVRVATPWPVLAAMGMLLVFTLLIGVRLARGDHPPCACFGAWSARPLSWRHVARNGGMLLLGVVALLG